MAPVIAADAMTKDFPRIRRDETVRAAVAKLLNHGWAAGLVLDDRGGALGVFGRREVLHGLSERLGGYLQEDELGFALLPVEAFRAETLRDVWRSFWETEAIALARREIPTVPPDVPLQATARALAADEDAIVAVVDEGRVVGVLRPQDLLVHLAAMAGRAPVARA